MTKILNTPKDALKLLAENMAQFENIRDNWTRSGNLMYADYSNKVYEAAAMFSGKVVMLQYQEQEKEEVVEVPPDPADLD